MPLCISRRHYDQLLKWAKDAGDRECCGLLLGQGDDVTELLLTNNFAPTPTTHFEIDPGKLITVEKAARAGGAAVLGYFHSHPIGLAQPSRTDAEMAATDGRYWVILAADTLTAWRAVANGLLHQRFDPVSLIYSDAQG